MHSWVAYLFGILTGLVIAVVAFLLWAITGSNDRRYS